MESYWKLGGEIVSVIANVLTMVTGSIALYIFFTKKDELSRAFRLLLDFSYQTTLAELREKLERLNEYTVADPADHDRLKSIMHEISGQIRGNERLHQAAPQLALKFEKMANGTKFTEPYKRSLVSETREILKNISVNLNSNSGV